MSGDRVTPRFDVVASTRRSWNQEQKRAIVAEVDAGASVSQVSRRHGLNPGLLFRWRRKLRANPGAAAMETDNGVPASTPPPAQRFVPVMLPPPDAARPAKPSIIEIVIAGGRTIRVGADVDTAALVRIVAALEAGR
jgi:transposase